MERILTIVRTGGLPLEARVGLEDWLERGKIKVREIRQLDCAVDVIFSGEMDTPLLGKWAEAREVDYAVQNLEIRNKKLLLCDMESTLIENEFLDELAEFCGVGQKVKIITARAMNGEIDFADSLRDRLGLLAGEPVGLLERAYGELRVMPGAKELITVAKAHGIKTVIVSGGFKYFTTRVRELLLADADFANDLEIHEAILTGHTKGEIMDRETKKRLLSITASEMGISMEATAAIGDGANDLPMLLASGFGVAFHAKPSVNAAAHWHIRHSDLRAMLYFMGIAG